MPLLPPTVHERLVECGTNVYVDGLVAGAEVTLLVTDAGGDAIDKPSKPVGESNALSFHVAPLKPGWQVQAMQATGSEESSWSATVIVDAAPPAVEPRLPEQVGRCSHCVRVEGLVPGCDVELTVGGAVVGKASANRHGTACVTVDLEDLKVMVLLATMRVCGKDGPAAAAPLTGEPLEPPTPVIKPPLFACQKSVPLYNLHRGSRVRIKAIDPSLPEQDADYNINFGSFCTCWDAANARIGKPLAEGQIVEAQAYWNSRPPCDEEGESSTEVEVEAPDERIKPELYEALTDGDTWIHVGNQIPGATLEVHIVSSGSWEIIKYGPRPAGDEEVISLAEEEPLKAGQIVWVTQQLCPNTKSQASDPVLVRAKPKNIEAPVVLEPLYQCAAEVQVSNLHPGAFVRIYQDKVAIGYGWSGEESSISITANPSLTIDTKITARQWVGNKPGPLSNEVTVQGLPEKQDGIPPPRILEPVTIGEEEVWVSGVTPGALVAILNGHQVIGQAYAAETITRVQVTPVPNSAIRARAKLCRWGNPGPAATPIQAPCSFTKTTAKTVPHEAAFSFPYDDGFSLLEEGETWIVPKTEDGEEGFETTLAGQIYYPSANPDPDDPAFHVNALNLPLVVIAHGQWPIQQNSYLGYDYLARHLVRWGMVVFSLNLDEVNFKSFSFSMPTHQYSRAEIILKTVDLLLKHTQLAGRLNPKRIGLVGHSMGGEAVTIAQYLHETNEANETYGFNIAGVVSIAPTNHRPEVSMSGSKYLQLLGSLDYLLNTLDDPKNNADVTGEEAKFSGVRLYDRAWRPKTHCWIGGARHNAFNRIWAKNISTSIADIALSDIIHERIAKCLINAFFQDALLDKKGYAGYMHGTILPPALRDFEIHTQHTSNVHLVLDNFGDGDAQSSGPDGEPLAEQNMPENENRQGGKVEATGDGLGIWKNIEHTGLHNSPHDTRSVQLSWDKPNVLYTSHTGGLVVKSTDVFSLRIAQFFEDAMEDGECDVKSDALNPVGEPLDLFVALSDGDPKHEATVRLGAVAAVPYPFPDCPALSVMRTVRLPIDAFQAANPALELNNIKAVILKLEGQPTGNILVDDLEFSSEGEAS